MSLQEEDSRKIADLLKHGAHCLHDLGAANEAGGAFVSEGIDQILQARLLFVLCCSSRVSVLGIL